ncbi:MAG TPA: hypothetical protein VGS12_06255 [Caulobacteraceae bacterium]|nr:hypothetical protein [Caulobacteraceae bacterium]
MSIERFFCALACVVLLSSAAGVACAQQAGYSAAALGMQSPAAVPVSGRRILEWDPQKGRWGLSLGVQQRQDGTAWRDVEPGLYYKVTPRLHIGGAVGLGNGDAGEPPLRFQPQGAAPRVRLETTFKF